MQMKEVLQLQLDLQRCLHDQYSEVYILVVKHDIRIKLKSYKFEFLGELVVYHGITIWFDKRS